ncbi:MAG TPA: tryptophan halogenase family protein [Steroidobacteraceae bacterium]|nr:tryptophan halogenase family protein [Steroidobacteraceae bacterium]
MTDSSQIKRIAIVGGGTAGWMAASILARALPGTGTFITVIESPDIGTVGVGEATIPPIIDLLKFLNINEGDFVKHTQSTYKLGIKFTDWARKGHSYWHPFGTFGAAINLRPFFHAWHKARAQGLAPRFNDFSLNAALGDAGRFRFPDAAVEGPVSGLRYALHFDAGLVAQYLRSYSERLGVARLERTVAQTTLREDGFLDELIFSDATRLQADLYIDCSGFRGVLIEGALKTGYLDWSDVLPCDRAVAMPTELAAARPPHTEAVAHTAGWRWRIPLQHRVGNGYVYSSAHIGDSQALDELTAAVPEKPSADPRFLRFVTGRRKLFWNRNCVALGLASGFLEPLESTSIHLVMSGVYKLLEHFPSKSFAQSNIDSYNTELIQELERIRDFIVLHYLTGRTDTPLWAQCQAMKVPDSLAQRIELYKRTGRIRTKAGELFTDLSWFYIFEGLGLTPESYDPLMDVVTLTQLRDILGSLAQSTAQAARNVPSHDSYFRAGTAAR